MQLPQQKNEKLFIEYIQSRRFLTKRFIICGLLFISGWFILLKNENHIGKLTAERINLADPSEYKYSLDSVIWDKDDISVTKDYVSISGWIIKPDQQIDKVAIRIVLKDLNTGEYSILPTDVTVRTDVTDYYSDGNQYDYCGFSVRVPYWDELNTTDYEILVQYDLNDDARVYVPLNASLKNKARELENERQD